MAFPWATLKAFAHALGSTGHALCPLLIPEQPQTRAGLLPCGSVTSRLSPQSVSRGRHLDVAPKTPRRFPVGVRSIREGKKA